MIKLGMLIGDRYEILEKIGTGGMSDVYKSKDHKLNRFVAIKVLKQEFSENKNFVSKFRVEAQAAAGLMHPNIVNVYDVGEEDDIHYIVMELVEGITLKKYIEKKSRLSTKEAISIAIQVAMGIEAAHNNHIIHRDIKPQNIIISKEGKVKVTDFGIAKAATSNTITSNVMGSVHYTSPEQARGGFSDEKSDIYSMGITFFEMVTGRVPFNGDTTVAIAIKHIQDPMPSPREFVPEIPVSVEKIILKCTQKSPDRRYQTMGEMIRDLKRSLINPDEEFVQIDTDDENGKTRVVDARPVRSNTGAIKTGNTGSMQNTGSYSKEDKAIRREVYGDEESLKEIHTGVVSQPKTGAASRPQAASQKNAVSKNTNQKSTDNMSADSKRTESKNSDQTAGRSNRNANANNSDKSNKKQTTAKKNASNVSEGNNRNKKQANSSQKKNSDHDRYEDRGYVGDTVNRQNLKRMEYDDDIDYGREEYDYNPKAEKITTVLTIIAAVIIGCILLYFVGQAAGIFSSPQRQNGQSQSEAAERAVMPEFVGKNIDDVKAALQSVGLGCRTNTVESTDYGRDNVISAALEDGQAVYEGDKILLNTTIVLTVSAGANGIKVPSVVGYTEAEGTAQLTQAGLKVNKTDEYSPDIPKGTIISQSPEGDSIAAMESEVTIVISKGNEDVEVRVPDVLGMKEDAAISTLEASNLVVGEVEPSYSSEYGEGQVCYQSFSSGTTVGEGTQVDLKISIGSEKATYSCSLSVNAPDDYSGGNAEVILTTADGTQQLWYAQNVTSFPVQINLNGFTSSSEYGVVTISYIKNVEEAVIDADGNTSTQTKQGIAQVQQNVQFVKD